MVKQPRKLILSKGIDIFTKGKGDNLCVNSIILLNAAVFCLDQIVDGVDCIKSRKTI